MEFKTISDEILSYFSVFTESLLTEYISNYTLDRKQ